MGNTPEGYEAFRESAREAWLNEVENAWSRELAGLALSEHQRSILAAYRRAQERNNRNRSE